MKKECPNCWGYQEYGGKPRVSCSCKKENEKSNKVNNEYALLGMILSK